MGGNAKGKLLGDYLGGYSGIVSDRTAIAPMTSSGSGYGHLVFKVIVCVLLKEWRMMLEELLIWISIKRWFRG
jgi:hypothetical protein